MFDRTSLLAGAVVGVVPVGVLSVDGFWDPWLAFFVWVSWTVVGLLFFRSDLRASRSRWRLLHILLVVGGAQFGVHMNLPIPSSLTIAIWFLVLGVGTASLLVGVQMGRENASSASGPTAPTTD
ncbi:hypothetical protein NDI76_01965 [Halogeometricum sp. S1BR25-6]|uniref:Uncharacterized protein n=1 Tax=Halogeometricum salsisoli TaxID=2950536 RepID=A0ABU2G9L9_9EURY|nr:hypothetical protein [Halogeometricum sp. S1BR25-6]MDS0297507.1 hypothetical protein [Halogeometricum sp. S1BR25-6]